MSSQAREPIRKRQQGFQTTPQRTLDSFSPNFPSSHGEFSLPDQPPDSAMLHSMEPRFSHDFSQIAIHSTQGAVPQTKLQVNQPGDIYEQEADQVAEQVMRMTDRESLVSNDDEGTENSLMRMQGSPTAVTDTHGVSPIIHDVLNSGEGQPLDTTTRAFMEPRFGHDFSNVRVHTDERAIESAQAVDALAYTIGQDIVFGIGQYAPGTSVGQRLLAHELTHTIQQTNSNTNLIQRLPSGTGPPVADDILGASESTSETVTLYHYGDIEGRDSFTSPPGYPRLTDCDIATTQAEASGYTGTPIKNTLRYKYEIKIDRVYFEKNFKNTGTRGAYSEFVTKEPIPARFFRRVLDLRPASSAPATSATSKATPETSTASEAAPATSATSEAAPGATPSESVPTRPTASGQSTTIGRIGSVGSTAVTVLGSLQLLKMLTDGFMGRYQIELKDLDPGDFEVGHEFNGVLLGKDDHNTEWYIDVRVERNIFFVRKFYAVNLYMKA